MELRRSVQLYSGGDRSDSACSATRSNGPDRVRGILANAGFYSVAINPLDAPIGGADVDQTLNLSLKMGPLGAP
jgi:hypothetical protein